MGKPSEGKDGEKPNMNDDDLVDVIDSVINNSSEQNLDSKSINQGQNNEQLLATSAKMVVETCMDIRRGENVLIVCDPTTG